MSEEYFSNAGAIKRIMISVDHNCILEKKSAVDVTHAILYVQQVQLICLKI